MNSRNKLILTCHVPISCRRVTKPLLSQTSLALNFGFHTFNPTSNFRLPPPHNTANMDSDSDSSLSDALPEKELKTYAIFAKAAKATKKVAPPPVVSPPRPKRAPSPPHEEVLADNPDIAVSRRHLEHEMARL